MLMRHSNERALVIVAGRTWSSMKQREVGDRDSAKLPTIVLRC